MNFKAPIEQHTSKVIEWSTKDPCNWNGHQDMPKVFTWRGKGIRKILLALHNYSIVSLYKFEMLILLYGWNRVHSEDGLIL